MLKSLKATLFVIIMKNMDKLKEFVILCRNFIESKFLVVMIVKQLNLFEIEDYEENITDTQNKKMEELVLLPEGKEVLDVQKALFIESLESDHETPQFQVMDKVKIILISEEIDNETHNYRKYYEAHLIGKVGEITNVHVSSKGKITYEVDVYGEKSIFDEAELQWIG